MRTGITGYLYQRYTVRAHIPKCIDGPVNRPLVKAPGCTVNSCKACREVQCKTAFVVMPWWPVSEHTRWLVCGCVCSVCSWLVVTPLILYQYFCMTESDTGSRQLAGQACTVSSCTTVPMMPHGDHGDCGTFCKWLISPVVVQSLIFTPSSSHISLCWRAWDLAVDHIISRFGIKCCTPFNTHWNVICYMGWDCHP